MKILEQVQGQKFAAYNCDTVEFTAELPENTVDFSVYSPPFSSLYIYSESERDMGNVANDAEFQECYKHLVKSLLRATRPGRLSAIHVKDLVYYSNSSKNGDRGIRAFSDGCIQTHVDAGWTFHGRVTIWRDPVREMQKTKSDRLLYKNFRTDAARSSMGLPEYLLLFRAWKPGMEDEDVIVHDPASFPLDIWQQWASPVWMDTDETNTLNVRAVRDNAEKHICPMPLDLSERAIRMWSNPGDAVYSPFMGIGSEGVSALKAGRYFFGTELKPEYFKQACKFLSQAEGEQATLFDGSEVAA